MNTITLYFTTRVGAEKRQVPFPVPESIQFMDVVEEACKKFGISIQTVSLATPSGIVLTATDMMNTVKEIYEKYGYAFEIIDQGVVG